MAVASLLTSLEDMDTSPTIVDYNSGPGAGTNTDVFIRPGRMNGAVPMKMTRTSSGPIFSVRGNQSHALRNPGSD